MESRARALSVTRKELASFERSSSTRVRVVLFSRTCRLKQTDDIIALKFARKERSRPFRTFSVNVSSPFDKHLHNILVASEDCVGQRSVSILVDL